MTTEEARDEPAHQAQKIGMEAVKLARIAAGYRGMKLQDYLTEVVLEAANWDLEQGHHELRETTPAPTTPPRFRKAKKKGPG